MDSTHLTLFIATIPIRPILSWPHSLIHTIFIWLYSSDLFIIHRDSTHRTVLIGLYSSRPYSSDPTHLTVFIIHHCSTHWTVFIATAFIIHHHSTHRIVLIGLHSSTPYSSVLIWPYSLFIVTLALIRLYSLVSINHDHTHLTLLIWPYSLRPYSSSIVTTTHQIVTHRTFIAAVSMGLYHRDLILLTLSIHDRIHQTVHITLYSSWFSSIDQVHCVSLSRYHFHPGVTVISHCSLSQTYFATTSASLDHSFIHSLPSLPDSVSLILHRAAGFLLSFIPASTFSPRLSIDEPGVTFPSKLTI